MILLARNRIWAVEPCNWEVMIMTGRSRESLLISYTNENGADEYVTDKEHVSCPGRGLLLTTKGDGVVCSYPLSA